LTTAKFDFGWGSALDPDGRACSAPQDSLAGLKSFTSKKKEKENRKKNGKGQKKRKRREKEGKKGKMGENRKEKKKGEKGKREGIRVSWKVASWC